MVCFGAFTALSLPVALGASLGIMVLANILAHGTYNTLAIPFSWAQLNKGKPKPSVILRERILEKMKSNSQKVQDLEGRIQALIESMREDLRRTNAQVEAQLAGKQLSEAVITLEGSAQRFEAAFNRMRELGEEADSLMGLAGELMGLFSSLNEQLSEEEDQQPLMIKGVLWLRDTVFRKSAHRRATRLIDFMDSVMGSDSEIKSKRHDLKSALDELLENTIHDWERLIKKYAQAAEERLPGQAGGLSEAEISALNEEFIQRFVMPALNEAIEEARGMGRRVSSEQVSGFLEHLRRSFGAIVYNLPWSADEALKKRAEALREERNNFSYQLKNLADRLAGGMGHVENDVWREIFSSLNNMENTEEINQLNQRVLALSGRLDKAAKAAGRLYSNLANISLSEAQPGVEAAVRKIIETKDIQRWLVLRDNPTVRQRFGTQAIMQINEALFHEIVRLLFAETGHETIEKTGYVSYLGRLRHPGCVAPLYLVALQGGHTAAAAMGTLRSLLTDEAFLRSLPPDLAQKIEPLTKTILADQANTDAILAHHDNYSLGWQFLELAQEAVVQGLRSEDMSFRLQAINAIRAAPTDRDIPAIMGEVGRLLDLGLAAELADSLRLRIAFYDALAARVVRDFFSRHTGLDGGVVLMLGAVSKAYAEIEEQIRRYPDEHTDRMREDARYRGIIEIRESVFKEGRRFIAMLFTQQAEELNAQEVETIARFMECDPASIGLLTEYMQRERRINKNILAIMTFLNGAGVNNPEFLRAKQALKEIAERLVAELSEGKFQTEEIALEFLSRVLLLIQELGLPEEIQIASSLVTQGKMDVNNPVHVLASYLNLTFSLQQSAVRREVNFLSYFDIILRARSGAVALGEEDIPEEHRLNIRGLVYEAFRMREKILELEARARQQGRKLVVIGNLSYGGVALSPITEERNGSGSFIVGTEIPVWYTKVGSTESHNNEFVLAQNLFSAEQLRLLAEEHPFVVVVDGSTSVADKNRTSAHIPDGFKGYRNFFMVLNQALYGTCDPAEFEEDEEFLKGLLDTPSAKELMQAIQGMSIRPRAPNAYAFRFWYERSADPAEGREEFLYLRVGKKRDTPAQKVDVAGLTGPTCVFMQSAIHPADVDPDIQRDFIGGPHIPAFFDDKEHFKEFYLSYEEGYGVVPSKRYMYAARREFAEFMRKAGRPLSMRAATTGKVRSVETLVLDLDGTLATTDTPLDNGTARLINEILAEGRRVVIITEDREERLDQRLKKLNRVPNLAIFSDSGTNGYSFDASGAKVYFSEHNVKSNIAPAFRQHILDLVAANFAPGSWEEDLRPGRASPDLRVDLRNVAGRTDFIKKLQQLLPDNGIAVKVYKAGRSSVKIVLQHKEDALMFLVAKFGLDKSKILLIGDSAHTQGVDRGLLTALPEAISINVGGFSATVSRENPQIVQYDNGGVETALRLLSNVRMYAGLPEHLIVPTNKGQPEEGKSSSPTLILPSTQAKYGHLPQFIQGWIAAVVEFWQAFWGILSFVRSHGEQTEEELRQRQIGHAFIWSTQSTAFVAAMVCFGAFTALSLPVALGASLGIMVLANILTHGTYNTLAIPFSWAQLNIASASSVKSHVGLPQANTAVAAKLKAEIKRRGRVTFKEFMEASLYDPEGGYYTSGTVKIGSPGQGHFSTFPEMFHPHFGNALARQLREMWENMGRPSAFDIVEMGAGNGTMARDILEAARQESPDFFRALRYKIIEISSALRQRQEETISQGEDGAGYAGKLEHINEEDLEAVEGVILSNELPDAMPVHRVKLFHGTPAECYVKVDENGNFRETWDIVSSPLIIDYLNKICALEGVRDFEELFSASPDAEIAVNLGALSWYENISLALKRGYILTIDYGLIETSFRQQFATVAEGKVKIARAVRTFSGHESKAEDVYLYPGGVDITSDVYFPLLRALGIDAGLSSEGYITQQRFLTNLGADKTLFERLPSQDSYFVFIQSKGLRQGSLKGLQGSIDLSELGREELARLRPQKELVNQEDVVVDGEKKFTVAEEREGYPDELGARETPKAASKVPGGIDLRRLPVAIQAKSAGAPVFSSQAKSGPDPEWQEMQGLLNSGIIPSVERIREYVGASCDSNDCAVRIERALVCLADTLRLEEETGSPTGIEIKELLVLLESGTSPESIRIQLGRNN